MVDRVDLLIAVIGIVISVVGSSTALWVTLARKPDREDLGRLESRLDSVEANLRADVNRIDFKLDGLIIRLVPEGRS